MLLIDATASMDDCIREVQAKLKNELLDELFKRYAGEWQPDRLPACGHTHCSGALAGTVFNMCGMLEQRRILMGHRQHAAGTLA